MGSRKSDFPLEIVIERALSNQQAQQQRVTACNRNSAQPSVASTASYPVVMVIVRAIVTNSNSLVSSSLLLAYTIARGKNSTIRCVLFLIRSNNNSNCNGCNGQQQHRSMASIASIPVHLVNVSALLSVTKAVASPPSTGSSVPMPCWRC